MININYSLLVETANQELEENYYNLTADELSALLFINTLQNRQNLSKDHYSKKRFKTLNFLNLFALTGFSVSLNGTSAIAEIYDSFSHYDNTVIIESRPRPPFKNFLVKRNKKPSTRFNYMDEQNQENPLAVDPKEMRIFRTMEEKGKFLLRAYYKNVELKEESPLAGTADQRGNYLGLLLEDLIMDGKITTDKAFTEYSITVKPCQKKFNNTSLNSSNNLTVNVTLPVINLQKLYKQVANYVHPKSDKLVLANTSVTKENSFYLWDRQIIVIIMTIYFLNKYLKILRLQGGKTALPYKDVENSQKKRNLIIPHIIRALTIAVLTLVACLYIILFFLYFMKLIKYNKPDAIVFLLLIMAYSAEVSPILDFLYRARQNLITILILSSQDFYTLWEYICYYLVAFPIDYLTNYLIKRYSLEKQAKTVLGEKAFTSFPNRPKFNFNYLGNKKQNRVKEENISNEEILPNDINVSKEETVSPEATDLSKEKLKKELIREILPELEIFLNKKLDHLLNNSKI
jgi:hypothetical protein